MERKSNCFNCHAEINENPDNIGYELDDSGHEFCNEDCALEWIATLPLSEQIKYLG